MATRIYPTPLEEIPMVGVFEEDYIIDMEELKSSLDDLDKAKYENRDLKKDLSDTNECINILRDKLKKVIHRTKISSNQMRSFPT